MKTYFQMDQYEKLKYQLMVSRSIQQKWEKAVIYQDYEDSYESFLDKYLEHLEYTEQYEHLQAFMDHYQRIKKHDNLRKQ